MSYVNSVDIPFHFLSANDLLKSHTVELPKETFTQVVISESRLNEINL